MIVYNVTVKIDLSVHDVWLKWMKEDHIPRVMETGCFAEYKMYRILQEDETEGITYAVQYFTSQISSYFDYQKTYAPALQKETQDFFPDKTIVFKTLLKEI